MFAAPSSGDMACGSEIPLKLSIVMRDMGNRVLRIESVGILPPGWTSCPSFSPLVFPLSPRLLDAVVCAMAALFVRGPPRFCTGCSRSVCDGVTEVFVW